MPVVRRSSKIVPVETPVSEKGARLALGPSSTALAVGIAVFAACVLGILTRPAGFLAMLWPANAMLLGLLIRLPAARRGWTWLFAALAYMLADLGAGTEPVKALLLNASNLCGVAAGYAVYRLLPPTALHMREPASALYIVLVAAVAAVAAGLAGGVTDPFVMDIGIVSSGQLWCATELVNYIALLPVILSAPDPRRLFADRRPLGLMIILQRALPAAALVVSCGLGMLVGGPGAIAFAVPALLWCGLAYPVFPVALLTFVFSCWSLTVMIATYAQSGAGLYDEHVMVSLRLAVFMIALAPVTLSIVVRNRDELIGKLSLARQRIDMAMDAGGIVATWDLNFTPDDLARGGALFELLEVDDMSGCSPPGGRLVDLIHPDDRERLHDALGAALATGTDYRCRCRIVLPDGGVRWLAAFGKVVRERRGPTIRLTGILVDVTEQTEAAAALEQSNTRFNLVSESIPQIVWSTDATGRHDYFNGRWTEFTGVDPDDIRPETWKGLVHPDDKARVDAAWAASLATGETYAIDYRFRYRDGSYRWLKVLAKPLHGADGAITRWYGTSTDIDDAKQLEAEREIVARELDHRIGNLFALVNGLVGFAARDGTDVKAVTDALRGRLSALHDAHALIRHGRDGAATTLTDLLGRLLAPYDNGRGRIAIGGDNLPVDPSATTSIALIFHELATNAVKYGALKDDDGQLRIVFTRDGDRLRIRWQEKCRPHTAPGEGTGFGSRLFDSIVTGQLRGNARRTATDDGITIDIELPVAALTGATQQL